MKIKNLVKKCCLWGVFAVALVSSAAANPDQNLNYAYLYYENGIPTSDYHRRILSATATKNAAAEADPDLVFQTGYYSLMFDCNDVGIKGYDVLAGSDYRTALEQDVSVVTPAQSFSLQVIQNGTTYDCESGLVQVLTNSAAMNYVRLIESGQFVKRIDHLGLIFKDSGGNTLEVDEDCRLEISAWPDRITFFLDFSSETVNPITQASIQLVSPDGVTHSASTAGNQARLSVKPQDDVSLSALNVNDYITEATRVQNGAALATSFDEDVHGFRIDVPADGVTYPSGINRVDEYLIEVTNSMASIENIPLVFNQVNTLGQDTAVAVTGTAMLLCDADSGAPLGIPVQVSKNWHWEGAPQSRVHYGSWLRGSTMLTLQPGESRRFKLRVIYGYWGGAGTASHAQLSLIGYGAHWKWDESALGAWGESLTYDPTLHAGAAFLDDIRPTFTTTANSPYVDDPADNDTHNWTENNGGGDFLIYRDSSNTYRWTKRVKTCYLQTGPNMNEVYYTAVTDDDKIRVTYASRMGSTLDYHRHIHDYKYEFLQDVVSPQRLVFHQMAADLYSVAYFDNYYIGDETGMLSVEAVEAGGNTYNGTPFRLDGKWLSIDDTFGDFTTKARSLRGIIPISSTLNGSAFPLYVHKYGINQYNRPHMMLFDLSSDSVTRSYSAGDVVEGQIEFIMPPQHSTNYWGGDAELENRLAAYGDIEWEVVYDEFKHNILMDVTVAQGSELNNYPLEIQPNGGNVVLADVTVNSGGIGHVPLVLKNAASGLELKVQRYIGGVWTDLETVNMENNTYYQAVQNADGTVNYTFTIPRPTLDLNEAWRVRVVVKPVSGVSYQTSFEGGFDGWINQSGDDFDWTRNSGTTTSGSTGPDGASDGSWYLYTEASNPRTVGDVAAISNRFDFSSYSSVEMKFDYHMYGADMGSLHLDVFDGAVWHQDVWSITGQQHTAAADPWATATVDLSAYVAGNITDIQFRGIVGSGYRSDMTVDNVRFLVSADGLDYGKWASDFGLMDAASAANPDYDALDNLYEYAFGGDPTNDADIGHVPAMGTLEESGTNWLEYVYPRRKVSNLNYGLETSTNLVSGVWTNSGYTELPGTGTIDAEFEAVTNRVDMTGKRNGFIRLKIEEQ